MPKAFVVLIFFASTAAEAHLMGTSPWCIANSPTHYECFFYDQSTCEKAAVRRTDDFQRWECLNYPPNFADLPKSDSPTPTPSPSPTPASEVKVKAGKSSKPSNRKTP